MISIPNWCYFIFLSIRSVFMTADIPSLMIVFEILFVYMCRAEDSHRTYSYRRISAQMSEYSLNYTFKACKSLFIIHPTLVTRLNVASPVSILQVFQPLLTHYNRGILCQITQCLTPSSLRFCWNLVYRKFVGPKPISEIIRSIRPMVQEIWPRTFWGHVRGH